MHEIFVFTCILEIYYLVIRITTYILLRISMQILKLVGNVTQSQFPFNLVMHNEITFLELNNYDLF